MAKVPGTGECKSRTLAMFFQVVVFCCHALLLHFIQTCVHVWLENKELRTRLEAAHVKGGGVGGHMGQDGGRTQGNTP